MSRSSTEAEYRCVASTAAEILWIISLLTEIGVELKSKPIIWCDNLSAVSLSANPVLHARTKHIEIDLYFVREQVNKGKLEVRHVPALYQRADVLTKALSTMNFMRFREELGVCNGGAEEKRNETLANFERGK